MTPMATIQTGNYYEFFVGGEFYRASEIEIFVNGCTCLPSSVGA